MSSKNNYRPDIDGLRAIAVIAVVLFHAWPKQFKGGFVGVDIFFVISGYLISKIIIESLDKGTFSFWDFYSRRVKRIFPALLTVLGTCLIFGWFALLPDEFKSLGKHTAAGAGFVSNFVLWSESGYFDVDSNLKPLLHLWSLGIEEQFYIFWPILLYAAWKFKVRLIYAIAAIFILSFIVNIFSVRADPIATFYSPISRAWELLIGAGLAYANNKQYKLPGTANFRSACGFILLLLSIALISKNRSFPGWWALVPTVGAALIISAQDAWLNKAILAQKILVWIGLISFPLYLWHWPLLSFIHILDSDLPTNYIIFAAVIAAFCLAWLTYEFIEKPIRNNKYLFRSLQINKVAALYVTMFAVGIVGFTTYKQDGFIWRSPQISALVQNNNWDSVFRLLESKTYDCYPKEILLTSHQYYQTGIARCRQTVQHEPKQTIALIGDSHAEHLFWGTAKGIGKDQNLVYFTYSCLPFIGLTRLDMKECEKMQTAIEYTIAQPSIKTVILANYWSDRLAQKDIRPAADLSDTDADRTFKQGLATTINALITSGKTVIFAFDVPSLDFNPIQCVRPFTITGRKCSTSEEYAFASEIRYRKLAAEVLKKYPQVKLWDPFDYLCRNGNCNVMHDDKFIYLDRNHVSRFGSERLGASLAEFISTK